MRQLLTRIMTAVAVVAPLLALSTATSASAAVPTRPPIDLEGVDGGTSSTVRDVTWLGDRMYIGGDFTSAGGSTHIDAAAIDMVSGDVDHGWNVWTNGMIYAIEAAADGSGIYIGGDFTRINGQNRSHFAKVDASTGALLPNQPVVVDDTVEAIAQFGNRLYLGGRFGSVNGTNHRRLAAFTDEQIDNGWFANADTRVRDIELNSDGTEMYVAGSFGSLAGSPAPRIGKLNALTGNRIAWAPDYSVSFTVIDLAVSEDDQRVYVALGGAGGGGNITRAVRASNGNGIWSTSHSGDSQAVLEHDGLVYVGGHFDNSPQNRLRAYDGVTGNLQNWAPNPNAPFGVWRLEATPWGMAVAGDFTFFTGYGVNRRHITVFDELDFGLVANSNDPTCTATVNGGTITLTWDPIPGEDTYFLRRNGAFLRTVNNTTTTATPPPGTYAFSVRSLHAGVTTDIACPAVTLAQDDRPRVRPYGVVVNEGTGGNRTANAVILLEDANGDPLPAPETITVDYSTGDIANNSRVAHPGSDFVATSGTVTFNPGDTQATFPVQIITDSVAEPALLYGEWGLFQVSNPSGNTLIDSQSFFGLGVIIIVDDD